MTLVSASLLLSTGWVLWSWAYAAHSHPVPADWTRSPALSTGATCLVVSCFSFGIGTLLAALVAPEGVLHDQTGASLGVTILAPVAAILIAPRIRRLSGATTQPV